jgi:hypothetical protein
MYLVLGEEDNPILYFISRMKTSENLKPSFPEHNKKMKFL